MTRKFASKDVTDSQIQIDEESMNCSNIGMIVHKDIAGNQLQFDDSPYFWPTLKEDEDDVNNFTECEDDSLVDPKSTPVKNEKKLEDVVRSCMRITRRPFIYNDDNYNNLSQLLEARLEANENLDAESYSILNHQPQQSGDDHDLNNGHNNYNNLSQLQEANENSDSESNSRPH